MDRRADRVPQLGLRANIAQFVLLAAVNALVGGMLGQERTVLPLLAERQFGLTGYTSALTLFLAFGATKAATNYVAGTLSDRYGRKPVDARPSSLWRYHPRPTARSRSGPRPWRRRWRAGQ